MNQEGEKNIALFDLIRQALEGTLGPNDNGSYNQAH